MSSVAVIQNRPLGRLDADRRPIPASFGDSAMRGDNGGGTNLIYIGLARAGALEANSVWQIRKLAYDGAGNVVSITWPQNLLGNAINDYEFAWANRATYTYS